MKKFLLGLTIALASPFLTAQTLPAGFTQTTVVTGLQYPCSFDWTPDGRYVIALKGGNSAGSCANGKLVMYSSAGALLSTFYDLTDSVNCDFERGLLGVAVDPDFVTNHYIYCYYVHKYGTVNSIRVLRFTEVANVGTAPTIIMDINLNFSPTPAGNHYGGNIHFRPSQPDKLYITIGDLAYQQGNPTLNYANKLNKPFGKILRINSNGTIPTDNPFYDDGNPATGNDDRIWSLGHRNAFDFCFNPVTDTMYLPENGWNDQDELNVVHKGANYGWATCEGEFVYNTTTPCTGFVNPVEVWNTPLPALTGAVFYTGATISEFTNHLLVADNDYGRIYDLTMGNPPAYDVVTSRVTWADITATGGLTTLKQGADGCIYAMKGGYTTNGQIYRICKLTTGTGSVNAPVNELGQNYPNPATGTTEISFRIAEHSQVNIRLFDISGRQVKTLADKEYAEGAHVIEVTDLDKLPAGTYFYSIESTIGGELLYSATRKLTIVK